MIGAAEWLRVALSLDTDLCAPMAAAIMDDIDFAIAMATQDYRTAADCSSDIITCIGNFAVMANKHPGTTENVLHLQIKYRWIGVNRAMNAVGAD